MSRLAAILAASNGLLRFLPLSVCVLAGVLASGSGSASVEIDLLPRVGGLDLGNPAGGKAERALTLGTNQGYAPAYDANASGSLLAARGTSLTRYYPPNRGFAGDPARATLRPGGVVDRYGGSGGSFVSPQGTPAGMRSLPHGADAKPLNAYEVLKPIEVDAGKAAGWFGQLGGGGQYDLGTSVQELVETGFLRPIP